LNAPPNLAKAPGGKPLHLPRAQLTYFFFLREDLAFERFALLDFFAAMIGTFFLGTLMCLDHAMLRVASTFATD